MKLKKATFEFRGWKFDWTYKRKSKTKHSRPGYKVWKVKVYHRKKVHDYLCESFVPSAHLCRRLKKRILSDN